MNASVFRNLWTRVMFDVPKIARAEGECDLKTSKNYEQHATWSSCDFLFIIFSSIVFRHRILAKFIELFVLALFSCLVDFPFCRPVLPNFEPTLCCFQSILVFRIFF